MNRFGSAGVKKVKNYLKIDNNRAKVESKSK